MEKSDNQLIAEYLKGDGNALEALVKRHIKSVYNFTRKYVNDAQVSEDITQETFVKAWKNLRNFDIEKGGFKTWLFVIAKNTALDFLKKKKEILFSEMEMGSYGREPLDKLGASAESFADRIADTAFSPLRILENAELGRELNLVLARLPAQSKKIITMRADGFSFREIAEFLREPLNTIKSKYRRTVGKIAKFRVD